MAKSLDDEKGGSSSSTDRKREIKKGAHASLHKEALCVYTPLTSIQNITSPYIHKHIYIYGQVLYIYIYADHK